MVGDQRWRWGGERGTAVTVGDHGAVGEAFSRAGVGLESRQMVDNVGVETCSW